MSQAFKCDRCNKLFDGCSSSTIEINDRRDNSLSRVNEYNRELCINCTRDVIDFVLDSNLVGRRKE